MPATLFQMHNARHSTSLRAKTESAILKTSKYVIEVETSGTTNHTERLAMAKKCLRDSDYLDQIVSTAMYDVGSNDDIATDAESATDSDIQYVVDLVYTDIALNFPPA